MTATIDTRIARLSSVSARQIREPEAEFDFTQLSAGRVLPDELCTTAGLDLALTEAQRVKLSREEVASMLAAGIRFEAVLNATFSLQFAMADDLDDDRFVYMLHEVGEETRHQRAFLRLREQLAPTARNPFDRAPIATILRRVVNVLATNPALFGVLLLAGEEIPDLLQKLASEHPDTDPVLKAVNKYHRAEEARHLAFARLTLPEAWARADRLERFRIRSVAPHLIWGLFDGMVHPGVYASVGLPGFATWRAAHRTPERVAIRHEATRAILTTMLDAGIVRRGFIPKGWRNLCGVDRFGQPWVAQSRSTITGA